MPDPSLTLSSLPLFPLGNVLFPGGLLPLRIFEVRYLDMVRKCHTAGVPFGVIALTHGAEVRLPGAAPERFEEVGTLATITALDTRQPNLFMLECRGTQRFHITRRERLTHGLWIADVQGLPDDQATPIPPDLQHTAQMLEQLLYTLAESSESSQAYPVASPWQMEDCGWVANRWCELLPLPLAQKQHLMALDNPLIRLELVNDFLGAPPFAGYVG